MPQSVQRPRGAGSRNSGVMGPVGSGKGCFRDRDATLDVAHLLWLCHAACGGTSVVDRHFGALLMKPHPWFNPPYRRWLTFAFCVGWTALEGWRDLTSLWFYITAALTVYAAFHFFIHGYYPMDEEQQ
jgi:hypothetical protein